MFSKANKLTTTPEPAPSVEPVARQAPAPSSTQASTQASKKSTPSLISADLKIAGDLISAGDLQIDGVVEGDIRSRLLTIGEGARISGSISSETVRVCGTVSGQINANSVILTKTAKVSGDIVHETLSMEAGAYFEGQVRRLGSQKSGGKAKSPAATQVSDSPLKANGSQAADPIAPPLGA